MGPATADLAPILLLILRMNMTNWPRLTLAKVCVTPKLSVTIIHVHWCYTYQHQTPVMSHYTITYFDATAPALASLGLVHGLYKAAFNIYWKVPCLVCGSARTPRMCCFFHFFTIVTNCTHGFITQLQDSAACWYIQHLFILTTQHT